MSIAAIKTEPSMADLWARLAAPLPSSAIAWRQDGRPVARDGKYFARFVCYVEAGTVRERLDAVVPGEWDSTLELLPQQADEDGVAQIAFKCRLQVLGVIREDVGTGKDYKAAATDAFKRAAVRFGIGHELYQYEQNWVQVDSDSKYAKPVEDPAAAYERKHGRPEGVTAAAAAINDRDMARLEGEHRRPPSTRGAATTSAETTASPARTATTDEPSCPQCGGRMWDNRATKRNPRAPDFKCRQRSCDGAIWPEKTKPVGAPDPADEGYPSYYDEEIGF